jgi:murE/murF fusion protein
MGEVAVSHADRVVLTSDNPRSEDPQAILDDIRVAAPAAERLSIAAKRFAAPLLAAHPAEVVLLAGKGHESYQEIAGVRRPFSDVRQARAASMPVGRWPDERDDGSAGAARATAGKLLGDNRTFCGVSTDSRSIAAGELFLALRGENFDGHDYVAAAQARGAAAVVAADAAEGCTGLGLPLVQVAETRLSLGALAADWRSRFTLPLIAVTGSNGKTTTKEMIASILKGLLGEAVLSTRGQLQQRHRPATDAAPAERDTSRGDHRDGHEPPR